jgi:DNA-binding response OmpR family regulator
MATGNILLVEDDLDIIEVIKMILEPLGFAIETCTTGEKIVNNNFTIPDLFILDGNLPRYSGVEICEVLKANDQTKNVPIIFMSANRTMISEVTTKGLAHVVEKPFESRNLLEVVESKITLSLYSKS